MMCVLYSGALDKVSITIKYLLVIDVSLTSVDFLLDACLEMYYFLRIVRESANGSLIIAVSNFKSCSYRKIMLRRT